MTRPIFIVGAPRSGTTLLQYMLRSHPRLSVPTGESHFIVPICQNPGQFGDLASLDGVRNVLRFMHARNPRFVDTDLHGFRFDVEELAPRLLSTERSTAPEVIRAFFELNALGEGKARWGDKTPYYAFHIRSLREWFPDAQFIHIVRDGRDCALSMFQRRWDFHVHNVYYAANYWRRFVEAAHEAGRHLDADSYFEFRYEDLLSDPEPTMRRLCAFLQEEFSSSVIDFRKTSGGGKTPLLGKPIQPDNAGKWRTQLTRMQISIFEAAAGSTLRAFGYPLTSNTASIPRAVGVLFDAHNRLVDRIGRRRSVPGVRQA